MHLGKELFQRVLRLRNIPGPAVSRLFGCIPAEVPEPARARTVAWVQSIRRHKTKTFLNVNDGTSPTDLQVSYLLFFLLTCLSQTSNLLV